MTGFTPLNAITTNTSPVAKPMNFSVFTTIASVVSDRHLREKGISVFEPSGHAILARVVTVSTNIGI
jgi:hypothetical protein